MHGRRSRCRGQGIIVIDQIVILFLFIIGQVGELIHGSGRTSGDRSGRATRSRSGLTIFITESVAADGLRDLVSAELLGLPTYTELRASEPDTRALDDHRDECTLDKDVLERDFTEGATIQIIDGERLILGGDELTILVTELDLQHRRVGLHVAIRITREAGARSVEGLDDVADLFTTLDRILFLGIDLKPSLRIVNALLDHEVVDSIQSVVDGRNLGVASSIIVAAELEINGILYRTILVEHRHTEGGLKGADLQEKALTRIVEEGGLTAGLRINL
jgi:hypothetical protein